MSDDQLKMPPERDYGFYQRRKHDKWREVPAPSPQLEAPVADTHAHVHMLPEPQWELERAAANGVKLISCVADPTEDILESVFSLADHANGEASEMSGSTLPQVLFTMGVHPHNAKDYSPEVEARLIAALAHPLVCIVGEIGLDYHYDLSPRDTQREIFRKQLRLAHELGKPVALHLRSGEDPEADDAHREAFAILEEEGFPEQGVLLHCCSLDVEQLQPWIDAGCYIAYGGAITFKKLDDARKAVHAVPLDRLLFETDSPYMTPEPMRGTTCTPAHVIFTAEALAQELGKQPGPERQTFLEQVWENSNRFLGENSREDTSKGTA